MLRYQDDLEMMERKKMKGGFENLSVSCPGLHFLQCWASNGTSEAVMMNQSGNCKSSKWSRLVLVARQRITEVTASVDV